MEALELDTVTITVSRGWDLDFYLWFLYRPRDTFPENARRPVPANSGSGLQPCIPPLEPQNRVDKRYVFGQEGEELSLNGYTMPARDFPNSGVTIGYGFDLGSKTEQQLINYGISADGLKTLRPFLGLKGTDAQAALTKQGTPTITEKDALKLSYAAFDANIEVAVRQFNALSDRPFNTLPANTQTAIADIAYNQPNLQNASPNFFKKITTGDWTGAVQELKNWTTGTDDKLKKRHDSAAAKIQEDIDKQLISPTNKCVGI